MIKFEKYQSPSKEVIEVNLADIKRIKEEINKAHEEIRDLMGYLLYDAKIMKRDAVPYARLKETSNRIEAIL